MANIPESALGEYFVDTVYHRMFAVARSQAGANASQDQVAETFIKLALQYTMSLDETRANYEKIISSIAQFFTARYGARMSVGQCIDMIVAKYVSTPVGDIPQRDRWMLCTEIIRNNVVHMTDMLRKPAWFNRVRTETAAKIIPDLIVESKRIEIEVRSDINARLNGLPKQDENSINAELAACVRQLVHEKAELTVKIQEMMALLSQCKEVSDKRATTIAELQKIVEKLSSEIVMIRPSFNLGSYLRGELPPLQHTSPDAYPEPMHEATYRAAPVAPVAPAAPVVQPAMAAPPAPVAQPAVAAPMAAVVHTPTPVVSTLDDIDLDAKRAASLQTAPAPAPTPVVVPTVPAQVPMVPTVPLVAKTDAQIAAEAQSIQQFMDSIAV
jgi:hypothetical protein